MKNTAHMSKARDIVIRRHLSVGDFISLLSITIIILSVFLNVLFLNTPKKASFSKAIVEERPQEESTPYVAGEVLVVFNNEVNLPEGLVDKVFNSFESSDPLVGSLYQKGIVKMKKVLPRQKISEVDPSLAKKLERLYKLELKTKDKESVAHAVEALKKNPYIEKVGPNYIYSSAVIPNDPLFSQQWGLSQASDVDINAPEAWDVARGSAQTVVSVVDSGIYYNHPDLQNKVFINMGETGTDSQGRDRRSNGVDDDQNGYIDDWHGWDATTCNEWNAVDGVCTSAKLPGSEALDYMGHGTAVSGIIAAATDNSQGVSGVDWNAKILPVKVLDRRGNGSCEDIVRGMEYVTGMRRVTPVANLGFVGGEPCVGMDEVVDFAALYGITFVAPSGNANSLVRHYPAAYDEVISVGAVDRNGNRASFSNYGGWVDFVAPGVDILSTTVPGTNIGCTDSDRDGYTQCSGTSMAAPFVTGVISLILSRDRMLLPSDIKNIIANSARDLGKPGKDMFTGYGIVRAQTAVTDMNKNKAPIAVLTFPFDGVYVGGRVDIEATVDVPNFGGYQVQFAPLDSPANWSNTGMDLTFPQHPFEKRRVAIWNTGGLAEGKYILRLLVTASDREYESTTTITLSKKILGGWPKRFVNGGYVNVADINADGKKELIVHERDKIWAFDKFGNTINTLWPVFIPSSSGLYFTNVTSVGNLVDDASNPGLEIVASTIRSNTSCDIYLYNYQGRVMQGWPQSIINNNIFVLNNQPLSDINGDGLDELIYLGKNSSNQVLLSVRNGGGQLLPAWANVVVDNSSPGLLSPLSTPVVGNINDTPDREIIVATDDGAFPQVLWRVKAYSSNAMKLWEYTIPQTPTTTIYEPYVVLGDITGDSKMETIVLYGRDDGVVGSRGLYLTVLNQNGSPIAPFNPLFTEIDDVYGSLIIGDLNKDKKGDILVNSQESGMSLAFNGAGVKYSGFPIPGLSEAAFITVGDINNDTFPELTLYGRGEGVLLQQQKGRFFNIYTYNPTTSTLTPYPGFELYFGYPSLAFSHAITDLDWDRKTEIVVMVSYGDEQLLYVFDPQATLGLVEWPMYFHDEKHTGAYQEPIVPSKPGDANMDGKVDGFDYVIWWLNFGKSVCGSKNGDFNFDCRVDGFDYVIWWLNFGT